MSDTPETDKLISDWYCNLTGLPNFVDIARKFERERDEAIFSKNTSASDFLKQIGQITLCKDVAREKLLMAEKERDETRKQFVDFLNKTEDYKRERDEARELLAKALVRGDLALAETKKANEKLFWSDYQDKREMQRERDFALGELGATIVERDKTRKKNAKLRDLAERAVERIEQENWGITEVADFWKQLRTELDRLKEGAK